jgi:single-strand DNA-binding protein
MASVNKVILIGNLGSDPDVRHFDSGSVVANITLATTESYKDKQGNRKDITEWHDIELWEGLAKISEQYLKKGDQIYIEGKIKTDTWQDENGQNRKKVKIRGVNMTMLKRKSDNNQQSQQPQQQQSTATNQDSGIDDLPF